MKEQHFNNVAAKHHLLVAAFLTTTYGKALKYVCPFNTLLVLT
jgi:hypothetical protein